MDDSAREGVYAGMGVSTAYVCEMAVIIGFRGGGGGFWITQLRSCENGGYHWIFRGDFGIPS